jgi:hypothetical protein
VTASAATAAAALAATSAAGPKSRGRKGGSAFASAKAGCADAADVDAAADLDDGVVAAPKVAAGAKKRSNTAVAADSAPSTAPKKKKAADRAATRHLELEVSVGGRDHTTATLHISRQLLFANRHCFGAYAKACIVCLNPLIDGTNDAGCDVGAVHCSLPSVLHL